MKRYCYSLVNDESHVFRRAEAEQTFHCDTTWHTSSAPLQNDHSRPLRQKSFLVPSNPTSRHVFFWNNRPSCHAFRSSLLGPSSCVSSLCLLSVSVVGCYVLFSQYTRISNVRIWSCPRGLFSWPQYHIWPCVLNAFESRTTESYLHDNNTTYDPVSSMLLRAERLSVIYMTTIPHMTLCPQCFWEQNDWAYDWVPSRQMHKFTEDTLLSSVKL